MEEIIDRYFKKQKTKKGKKTVSDKLFLSLIYSKIYTYHDIITKKMSIEHIIPQQMCKDIMANNKMTIPIDNIGNLCYIDSKLNKSKGSKTFYHYCDNLGIKKKNEKINMEKSILLIPVDDLKVTSKNNFSSKDYGNLMEKRQEKLKNKLFSDYTHIFNNNNDDDYKTDEEHSDDNTDESYESETANDSESVESEFEWNDKIVGKIKNNIDDKDKLKEYRKRYDIPKDVFNKKVEVLSVVKKEK